MNISYDMENMILKISKDGNIIYEANLKNLWRRNLREEQGTPI